MQSIPFEPYKSASFADSALKKSVGAMEQAQQCVHVELKFSKTRTGDFVQLARKLEQLPAVRESVENGKLGYTTARDGNWSGKWLSRAKGPSPTRIRRSCCRLPMI
jgi:hypothetical protein